MAASSRQTILVVDDEANLRKVLAATLRREGFEVLTAQDGVEGLALLAKHPIDVLLTDLRMPQMDGMALLAQAQAEYPEVPVVMLTAHGTVDTAVTAMKLGAFDYLTKPFDSDELRLVIRKAAASAEISAREASEAGPGRFGIIGVSAVLQEVFKTIEKVAPSPSTVLVTGESGTGKELVARALHAESPRRDKPFIRINCAAIPRELIESELFGYEKGAFTGAVSAKPGRFELADEGTLFLDEIGEIPLEMQVKLLRALQESEFERVGGVTTTKVDVRLVAATNQDLAAEVKAGRFREDLFYRLNVVPIVLPPLRERREDIPLLVEHFRTKYNDRLGKKVERVDADAIRLLCAYAWPGNIRELENVMERAVLFAEEAEVTPDELPEQIRGKDSEPPTPSTPPTTMDLMPAGPVGPLKEIVRLHTETVEKDLIRRALEETGGNVTKAARRLEISRKSLQNKMKELGLRDTSDEG
ncbi:MAG: sigma-54-dependent Fis family transcriptional regulator [Deltaproteobacteria bacterium]|nr:sigma-54-dependent Fis family transcriptional regulator [Deltaproteobacteria bacterium]